MWPRYPGAFHPPPGRAGRPNNACEQPSANVLIVLCKRPHIEKQTIEGSLTITRTTMGLYLTKMSQETSADSRAAQRGAERPTPPRSSPTLCSNICEIHSAPRRELHSWSTLEESYRYMAPVEEHRALNDRLISVKSPQKLAKAQAKEFRKQLEQELLEMVVMAWGSCSEVQDAFKLNHKERRKLNLYAVEHIGIPRIRNGEGCDLVLKELGIDDSEPAKELLWTFAVRGVGTVRVANGEDWQSVFESLQIKRSKLAADALDSNKLHLQRQAAAVAWAKRVENGEGRETGARTLPTGIDAQYETLREKLADGPDAYYDRLTRKLVAIYAKS